MNNRPLRLEVFDTKGDPAPQRDDLALAEAIETARIAGYDSGYKTGWDDAIRQSNADGSRIGAEFARNLRDLSFTFHEARAHVMRSLDGLLDEITATFLPAVMAEALGPSLKDIIMSLAEDVADSPVLIRASPAEARRLHSFLSEDTNLPVQIVEEPSLAEGQAYLKLGAEERQVDLSEALQRLIEGIEALRKVTERTLDERRAG